MNIEGRDVWLIFATYMLFIMVSLCCNLIARVLCGRLNGSNPGRNGVEDEEEEIIADEYSMEITSGDLVINALPVYQIKKGEEMAVNVECAICLGEFEEGEWIKLLPNCTHGFHVSCIDTWFRSHSNCPLCRSCVPNYTESSFPLQETEREESEEFSTGTDAHFQSLPSQISPNLEIVDHHCPH